MIRLPRYAAMLAAPGELPSDDEGWAFEIKYDGIRAGGYVSDRVQLVSRNGNDLTAAWPELADLAGQPPFVLDGEIVAFVEGCHRSRRCNPHASARRWRDRRDGRGGSCDLRGVRLAACR
ncbi:ATP-dependent DNA ligase [Nocardia nova]